jgi:hypothetical protein
MVAKPVETGVSKVEAWRLTEPLARLAAVLDDLHDAGAEGLDGGNVVGEDAHVTGRGGDVDLGHAGRREEGLVGEDERELELVVGGGGVPPAQGRGLDLARGDAERRGEAESGHFSDGGMHCWSVLGGQNDHHL